MALLILAGSVVSAVLSSASNLVTDGMLLFNPIPGILFSLVLMVMFSRMGVGDARLWKRVVLLLASAGFYMAAVWSTIYAFGWLDSNCGIVFGSCERQPWASFFAGGLIGALLLLATVNALYRVYSWQWVLILGLCGGLLGMVGAFELQDTSGIRSIFPFILLYILWQCGMAFGIWYAVKIKMGILQPAGSV